MKYTIQKGWRPASLNDAMIRIAQDIKDDPSIKQVWLPKGAAGSLDQGSFFWIGEVLVRITG